MSYTSAAIRGGIIGAIVFPIIRWFFRHFAIITASIAGFLLVCLICRPFMNTDTNDSEMRAIIAHEGRANFEVQGPAVIFGYVNQSRFRLENVVVTCGGQLPTTKPVTIEPFSASDFEVDYPLQATTPCTFTYSPLDVHPTRSDNMVSSSEMMGDRR